MATPAIRLPYHFISELPTRARDELYRNFLEIEKEMPSGQPSAFHAFVDNSQPTDASVRRYAGISEAINAMSAVGDHLAIWVKYTGTPYLETVVANRASNTVTLVGEAGFGEVSAAGMVRWDTTGFLPNVSTLIMHNIWINGSVGQNGIVGNGTNNIVAWNCYFSAATGSFWASTGGSATTGASAHFINCVVDRMNMNITLLNWYGGTYLSDSFGGVVNWTNPGSSQAWKWNISDVRIGGGSMNTSIAGGTTSTVLNFDNFGSGVVPQIGGPASVNFTLPNGCVVKWQNRIQIGANGDSITLANPTSAIISGSWTNIARTNTGANGNVELDVVTQGLQCAGPANINADVSGAGSSPVILSGSSINAKINLRNAGTPNTAIQCQSLRDSVVVAQATLVTPGTNQRSLSLDAGCARNVVVLSGIDTGWDLTYVDQGANNLVITRNGMPPAGVAGGDLAGTYPSPTVQSLTALNNFGAKGDLLVATADNTPARLGVGANQRILAADSSATPGVAWKFQRTLNNRLTQNQASLEASTAGWAARTGSVIARSTAQSSHGAASLEITKS